MKLKLNYQAGRKEKVPLQHLKCELFREHQNRLPQHQRYALQHALNEAESLAVETLYPELVFPLLAKETAEAMVRRQLRSNEQVAFAE